LWYYEGLIRSYLEKGDRKLNEGEGKRVYVQPLTTFGSREPETRVALGILNSKVSPGPGRRVLYAVRWPHFGCSMELQSMGFLLLRGWLDFL
jgi:hypothetical protein